MATNPRVLLGQRGSDYGLWVSKSGEPVTTADEEDMLFSTMHARMAQILFYQAMDVGASSTTTQTYLNHGGIKCFYTWWTNYDALDGGENDYYENRQNVGGSVALTLANEYTNATTNTLTLTNIAGVAMRTFVLVIAMPAG